MLGIGLVQKDDQTTPDCINCINVRDNDHTSNYDEYVNSSLDGSIDEIK